MEKREFSGVIPPLKINGTNYAGLKTLVDWEVIFNKHLPSYAVNPQATLQLEYLQCDYFLASPARIPRSGYPDFDEVLDSAIERQLQAEDFKKKFNQHSGHAYELQIYTQYDYSEWGDPKATELLYNLGQYGYLNLLSPYILKDAEVALGDPLYKIGIGVTGTWTNPNDHIEFNGGYRGSITYEVAINPDDYRESAGRKTVTDTATQIVGDRTKRCGLYVINEGPEKVLFEFTTNTFPMSSYNPVLDVGQSLTLEQNNLYYPTAMNKQYFPLIERPAFWINLPLRMRTLEGESKVSYQDFWLA